jgi:alcohol dehydrogenase
MKTIRFESPKVVNLVDTSPPPPPGLGEVQVRTWRMGVCGTDIGGYLGKFPFFSYPRIPGHELGVEVVAVGEGVQNVQVGDRCAVEPYMNCGSCFACRHGSGNCCVRLEVIGVMCDGGLRERFNIRADKLHASSRLSYEQLALVETLAIGCHAVDRGVAKPGEATLVIGAGPIGLSVIEFARLRGARLAVMDLSQDRLDFCKRVYGIDCGILPLDDGSELDAVKAFTNSDGFPLVFDATGHPGSMVGALKYLAPTGRLVYVGITAQPLMFMQATLHKPEVTLLASRNALPKDFPFIIDLIENGKIDTTPWITRRLPFEYVPTAFAELAVPQPGMIKTIIDVAA